MGSSTRLSRPELQVAALQRHDPQLGVDDQILGKEWQPDI